MSEAGYTASEALAALAIVGLSVGGLTSGLHVIGRTQAAAAERVEDTASMRQAEAVLRPALAAAGPLRSDQPNGLRGDAHGFSFPCGAQRCAAVAAANELTIAGSDGVPYAVRLPSRDGLALAYVSDLGATQVWPPAQPPPPARQWEVLKAIVVADSSKPDASPVAVVRLWPDQTANCDYDAILQDCRGVPQ